MNEILNALEAMVVRIVGEQIEERDVLTRDSSAQFMNTWKESMRRYPADYRAVVQDLGPAQAQVVPSVAMTDEAFVAYLTNFIRTSPQAFNEVVKQATLDKPWFDDAIKSEVAEANPDLRITSIIHEVLTEKNYTRRADLAELIDSQLDMNDVVTHETLGDKIDNAVRNADFDFLDDQIRSTVSDMDFTTTAS